MAMRKGFLMDGPLALDQLIQAWGDSHDISHDSQTWQYRRKDGTRVAHAAPSPGELHKLIANDHTFFPLRKAS
jgi:hypothetical protein